MRLPFFHRNPADLSVLFPDGMDRHSHILWGIDDGAQSPEDSQAIINAMRRIGLRGAWCTPHVMAELPDNTASNLRKRYNEALATLDLNDFDLRLAAEYMLDESFLPRLKDNSEKLLTYDGKRLLIEFSRISLPGNWEEMIFLVQAQGYIPVLAHPERYGSILDLETLELLHQNEVEFQINLSSLIGMRGRHIQKLAQTLRKKGLCNWIGTDAHRPEHVRSRA